MKIKNLLQVGIRMKPAGNFQRGTLLFLLFLLFFTPACKNNGEYKKYMLGQIKRMADITLVEVKFKKYLILKQDKKILFFNLETSTQVMCIYPRIELGVNLDQITEKDVTIDENSGYIRLELPPVTVKKFEYDEKDYADVKEAMTKNAAGNTIEIEKIELMHRYAENEVRKSINIPELKRACEEKARINFQAFFASLGYSVDVIFKPSSEPYLISFDPDFNWDKELEKIKRGQ